MAHNTDASFSQQLTGEKAWAPTETVHIEEGMSTTTSVHAEQSAAEKKLVRKLDFLVPFMLGISYFFAYLV